MVDAEVRHSCVVPCDGKSRKWSTCTTWGFHRNRTVGNLFIMIGGAFAVTLQVSFNVLLEWSSFFNFNFGSSSHPLSAL